MAWKDYENESTADLIEFIRWGRDPQHREVADEAFMAFCFRFCDDVQHKCRVICAKRNYDTTVGDEIANKTFDRFYKYPNYTDKKCKSGDIDTCVKLYLYRFARNALSDYETELKDGPNPFSGEEEIIEDFPDFESMDIPVERKAILQKHQEIIEKALERLSEKHKIIYLTYKQYESETKEGYYLPRSLTKRLREKLGLTQNSVQVYKKEAFDKVDEYLTLYGKK